MDKSTAEMSKVHQRIPDSHSCQPWPILCQEPQNQMPVSHSCRSTIAFSLFSPLSTNPGRVSPCNCPQPLKRSIFIHFLHPLSARLRFQLARNEYHQSDHHISWYLLIFRGICLEHGHSNPQSWLRDHFLSQQYVLLWKACRACPNYVTTNVANSSVRCELFVLLGTGSPDQTRKWLGLDPEYHGYTSSAAQGGSFRIGTL